MSDYFLQCKHEKKAFTEKLGLAKQIKEFDLQYAQSKNSELSKNQTELQTRFDHI